MIERVLIDIIGRDKFSKAADTSAASAMRGAKKIDGAAAMTERAGARLTKSVTVPMLAIGAVSLAQAAKFQKANTLLQTAGGESVRKMRVITAGMKKAAVDTATDLNDLQRGMYTVAKAGAKKWSAVDQLKVLRASAEAAKIENSDLSTQVDATTSVMLSYGTKASKVVQVENMLVKGSALAKTTMQQFAGSLSNVIPLAAALHIPLKEVLGDLATMTQHGEGPQQASENLSNLFTNLAGSNSVAASTMQQLNINTVYLQKNLHKLGASGALAYIEKHLAANSKGGMVVVKAFKESALATHSLDVMLSHMSGTLRNNSAAFLAGKMGFTEYRKYVRGLGGEQYALGNDFLKSQGHAQGFNDQLRSGNGDVRTAATMLQKMLGGMTGMKVALMLTGSAAKQNASNIRQIGDAADHSGKHVIGFDKTSKTFSFRLDKMKSSAKVFAVDLGTDLLPIGEKVVHWLTEGVQWFDKLSPAMRHNIETALAVAAVLGPVLIVGGKLIRTVKTMWTIMSAGSLATRNFSRGVMGAGASVETMGTKSWTAGAKLRSAFGGASVAAQRSAVQIAEAEDAQTRAVVSNADRQIAALASVRAAQRRAAMGGAMPGAAAGVGPAARGGRMRAAGVGVGFGLMLGGQALGGAIAGHSAQGSGRNMAGTAVSDAGTGAMLGSFFGPEGMAVGAALGGAYGAVKSFLGGLNKLSAGMKDLNAVDKHSAETIGNVSRAVLAGGKALRSNESAVARVALSHTSLVKTAHKAGMTEKDLTNAIVGNQAAFDRTVAAMRASGQVSDDEISALEVMRDQFKQGAVAARKFADAHGIALKAETHVTSQTAFLSGKLGNLNALHLSAAQNAKMFRNRLDEVTTSVKANGTSLDGNTSFGQKNIAAIREAAAQSLAHAQAVYQQTGSIKKADQALANDRTALIKTATQSGLSKKEVKKLADQLANVPKHVHSKVTVDTAAARRALTSFESWFEGKLAAMSGGKPSKLQNGNGVNTPGLIGNTGPTNAKGSSGVRDGFFTVGEEGGPNGWELGYKRGSHVEIYSNRDARKMTGLDRLPGYAKGTKPAKAASDAIGSIGGSAYANPISISTEAEYRRVERQIRHAVDVLNTAIVHGLSHATADKYRAEIHKLAREAQRQLEQLQVSKKLDALNARLGSAPTAPTAYDHLATARGNYANERSSVKSAVLGGFNIATAGQVYNDQAATGSTILASVRAMVAKAKKFDGVLKALRKMGLSPVLLSQLANAGPDALDQAETLKSSGAGTIKSISVAYAHLGAYGNDAGKVSADAMYGAGVKSAKKLVAGMLSQRRLLEKVSAELARGMVANLDRALHPSHGHGKSHGKHSSGGGVHVDQIIINDQRDPVASANAVMRRLAHLGAS